MSTYSTSASAQGSASVVANGATTYATSGTAQVGSSVTIFEIFSHGPLKNGYVFLDAFALNGLQVSTNFLTLFSYLNSQQLGIETVVDSGVSSVAITGINQSDSAYLVTVIPTWNTTYWITNKSTSGFTINFGTAPSTNTTFDWRLMR